MKRFHDYNTFKGLQSLKDIVAKQDPSMSEDLMKALFPLRNKEIGQTLQDIINRFESSAEYATPQDWFTPTKFKTFMEYFTRKLTKKKTEEIDSRTNQFSMIMPAEANIESIGDFLDTSSILRLKKPTKNVVKDLVDIGISDVHKMEYISLKLLKCYYHRVHCPVDGTIQKITFVGTEDLLFGDNSLWVVEINSEFGRIYMLIVGELSIQDFNFRFNEGDQVKKFEELGNFNWGSQLVIIFEKDGFKGIDVLIREKEKFFVGDGIISNKEFKTNNWEAMPDTEISRNNMGRTGIIVETGVTHSPNDATIF